MTAALMVDEKAESMVETLDRLKDDLLGAA